MENAIKVRVGMPDDFPALMDLLFCIHKENGLGPMDSDRVADYARRGLARDRSIVGIAEDEGKLAGSVSLFVSRWWYAPEHVSHLEDLWNYVHPDFRRRPVARPLIEFAKTAANSLKMPLLMGVLSGERTAAKLRLYERQLPQLGGLFYYDPDTKGAV